MPSIEVRPATAEDAAGIAGVHISSWQGAYAHVFPTESLAALDELADRRADHWARTIEESRAAGVVHTLVAVAGDRVVGFADVRASRDEDADSARVGELTAIYVAPETWSSGAGRLLMAASLERLAAFGVEEATLWVLEDNPRARRFYQAAGWTADGRVKDDEFLGTPVREVRYRKVLE